MSISGDVPHSKPPIRHEWAALFASEARVENKEL